MKYLVLTPIIFLSFFTRMCFAELFPIYPLEGDIVYLDCGNEKLIHKWQSDPPDQVYAIDIMSSTYSYTGITRRTDMPLHIYYSGEYAWRIRYTNEDGQNEPKEEDIIHFEIVCASKEPEVSDIPEPQEEVEEPEIIKEEQKAVEEEVQTETTTKKEEKPLTIPQKVVAFVKGVVNTITTSIKDIFSWNIDFKKIDFSIFTSKVTPDKPNTKPPPSEKDNPKPFSFPFKNIIGVTQWHGNTAFQKPHTGIDFGATQEEIISPGDGQIVAIGWDNFNGECFSGGNYLIIKHTNGMHTAYFHIEKQLTKMGQSIKKGTLIAISGNSGKWNCQNLKYHLHFETRKGRYQDTHVNPVEYVDIDWNKVPTLGYKYNPGRLSGENPHPTF